MYLCIISWQPSLWNWLQKFPLIASGITILALLSGIVVFTKAVPPFFRNFAKVTREGGLDATFMTKMGANKYREEISDLKQHHIQQFKQEDMVVTNRMERITEAAERDSKQINECFLTVHALCTNQKKQLVQDQELRKKLFELVQRILPSEQHILWAKIAALSHDIKKIYNFDLQEIRSLSDKYAELKEALLKTKITNEDLSHIKRVIAEEHKKHRFENQLGHLEHELKEHMESLRKISEHLGNAVGNAEIDKAASISEQGADEAQHGYHFEQKIEHLERKIDMWTKRIIRELSQLKEVNVR
jgi:hypothetical protein